MGGSVRAIAYHPYWHVPLIAASSGVYFLVLPQKEEPVVALGITVTGEMAVSTRTYCNPSTSHPKGTCRVQREGLALACDNNWRLCVSLYFGHPCPHSERLAWR